MRRAILVFIFLTAIVSIRAKAQNAAPLTLIVGIPAFSEEKTLPALHSALDQAGNISVMGYCSSLKLVIIHADKNFYNSPESVALVLKQYGIEGHVKQETDPSLVIDPCRGGFVNLSK